ncbi:MAG: alpha/beta hydrolase [Anaerolinea sp.]|nr:alpha/beta hydrolase [Anaerolinea sp.]
MPMINLSNQGLFYEDSGGDKPAVLMMHGFLFDQSMFDPQVKALDSKYRCIRFDARGFGQTKWDGNPFTLYDTAADALALLDYLGIQKAAVLGMSQGGYAALRFALKYPEWVSALVFISTYNGADTEDVKEIYRAMRETWRIRGPEVLLDTFLNLFIGADAELRSVWRAKWALRTAHEIFHTMNNLINRDEIPDDQLAHIRMPAMVIHGEDDQGIPLALGEAFFHSLPNHIKMVRVPGAAHGVNLTHPEQVNLPLLEFLDQYVAEAPDPNHKKQRRY